jgi:hypothetical protein
VESEDFDLDEYRASRKRGKAEPKVRREHIVEVFRDGDGMTETAAKNELMRVAKCEKSCAYNALKKAQGSEGPLGGLLQRDADGVLLRRPDN